MDSKNSRQAPGTLFEFFLYAFIISETAAAALVYKFSTELPELGLLRLSLGILYFGFLTWAIFQLNRLHRKRKQWREAPPEPPSDGAPIPPAPAPEDSGAAAGPARIETALVILGLTRAQIMVVLVVFVGALMAFYWTLATLR